MTDVPMIRVGRLLPGDLGRTMHKGRFMPCIVIACVRAPGRGCYLVCRSGTTHLRWTHVLQDIEGRVVYDGSL